ncbi:TetR/AcrR family transcriptional regulator [Devriesea agamarum]|uniref:TetR/AcrR family transcriptional regulator n=1 Tax=Devriesea agamarum TaxID=472569 RepID=UPI00071DCA0B|nr:TetR/AcrR family transcriptional regulator [Devriesea agamarum]
MEMRQIYSRPTEKRARRTVDALAAALKRLLMKRTLGEVTVSDLCREAGIHRTTFYGHFRSVDDCARSLFTDAMHVVRGAEWVQSGPLDAESFGSLLCSLQERLRCDIAFVRRLYGPDGDPGAQRLVIDQLTSFIRERLCQPPTSAEALDLDAVAAFLGSGGHALVERWVLREEAVPHRTVMEAAHALFPPILCSQAGPDRAVAS